MLKQLVAFTVALSGAAALTPVRAEIIEQVLVKVNGDIISKSELETRQIAELRNRPELANVTPASLELQKAIAEITPNLILNAVDELLIIQRGREIGLTLGDEQFNTILKNIRESNNLQDDTRFQEMLKQEGLTLPDLRRVIERNMLVSEVQRREVGQKMSVTEEEAKAYYETHRQDFTTPSEITLREILIEVPTADAGVNVAQDDEARAKAEDIHKRLLAGEPFARLAGEASAAPSKANGGLIGPVKLEELAPQLRQVFDKMTVGALTGVQRTTRGYQILKLESRTETKVRTFDEARSDIMDKVMQQKAGGELRKYIDRLREQATITWRNDELKKAYELALARRQSPATEAPRP